MACDPFKYLYTGIDYDKYIEAYRFGVIDKRTLLEHLGNNWYEIIEKYKKELNGGSQINMIMLPPI